MILLRKIWYLIVLLLNYLVRLVQSNIYVAYDILTPKFHMKPGIVRVPVRDLSDMQLLALINLVTMAPGTLSLDLSKDKATLYIHAMYVKDREAFYSDIKALEKMIKRVF